MGNSLGGKNYTKIMKINGETLKLKTPVQVGDILKDYPGHALLESEAVKHFGVRAKPLEPLQVLDPERLYFLVELPKFPEEKGPRRARSGINMRAKDRLESLMLSRRSVSELSILKQTNIVMEESKERLETGGVRLKMRIPKAEVAKLVKESKDEAEATEKIVDLCMAYKAANGVTDGGAPQKTSEGSFLHHPQSNWKSGHGRVVKDGLKAREKRVGFLPFSDGEIQLSVAS